MASMIDGLRLAKVAAIHPEAHAVDLVFLDNGSQIPLVQVMSSAASTNSGLNDLAEPSLPASGDKWDLSESKDRDIMAVVGFFHELPIVLGFLYPQVCQMLFADKNRRVNRHASDVYTSVDADGNTELFHPSGTYLRIGTTPAHEDLTGQDYDQQWKIEKNTDKAVHVHLEVANAGTPVASLGVDPSGNVALEHDGNLTADTGGNAVVDIAGTLNATVQGDITATTPATVTVDAPQSTFTGAVTVQGLLTYEAGMNGTGGANISGNVSVSGGDVDADGVSLKTHTHPGDSGGNTGPPN